MTAAAPARLTAETSVAAAVRLAAATLRAAGIENSERDARFLVQGIVGLTAEDTIKHPDRRLGGAVQRLQLALERRLAHEPVSRILGWREFYGRRFQITADVLDPRPETETLITAALEIATQKNWRERPVAIADIGAGSGILIATLLLELPDASGFATDISAAALDVARRNCAALTIAPDRLRLIHARGLGNVARPLDLIVSNPPYIPSADIKTLDRDVQNFDPALALDGGEDGLKVYREIADEIAAKQHTPDLTILVEIGAGQHHEIATIFDAAGFRQINVWRDLAGVIRVLGFEPKNAKIGDL